jgi:hypothetical protein
MLKNFLYSIQNTELGKYIISIILGIGLASLFRKSCEGRSCMVFRGPSMEDIRKSNYKYGEEFWIRIKGPKSSRTGKRNAKASDCK